MKALIIIGLFVLVLSSGLVLKDWGHSDDGDIKLMSEDDYNENIIKLDTPSNNILKQQAYPYQLEEKLEYKEVRDGSSR